MWHYRLGAGEGAGEGSVQAVELRSQMSELQGASSY